MQMQDGICMLTSNCELKDAIEILNEGVSELKKELGELKHEVRKEMGDLKLEVQEMREMLLAIQQRLPSKVFVKVGTRSDLPTT